MYNTKYQIFFRSVNNELFQIQIKENNYNGSVTELTGGVSPFLINYDSESEFLYNPLRFSGGTLKVVGSDYLQSLFSTNYQQYKVNLLDKSNKILWTGYITPELYSQEYSGFNFELEIECISALSTLEYFKFEKKTETISLFQLIKDSINKANGDYSNIYIPIVYGTSTTNILNEMIISSNNFIDEDGEAMNYKNILEEICKFLGWTMTERDGDIYFIDVDYIKSGNNQYFKYNSTLISVSVATLSTNKLNVQEIGSEGIENSLSIIGGFNKINVIASDYEADKDNLYPEFEFDTNTKLSHAVMDRDNKRYQKEYYNTTEFIVYTYKYNASTKSYASTSEPMFNNINKQKAGSVAVQQSNYEINNMPNKLNWTKMFEIKQFEDDNIIPETYLCAQSDAIILSKYPIVRTKTSSSALLFDPSIRLAIDFQIYYMIEDLKGIIGDFNYKINSTDKFDLDKVYIPARLRCGSYYYNGTGWTTDSNNSFKLFTDIKKKSDTFGVWFNARNTNDFTQGTNNLNGTIINFDRTIIGDLELILYNPKHELFFTYAFIKDISIDSQKINYSTVKENSKKDTLYTNVVNESFINEADDIELIITSSNNSELSFSKVIINNNILNTINNKITNKAEKPEKLLIQRVINQYKQPKLKLLEIIKPNVTHYQLITDNKLINKDFIIINENIDYYNDTDEITMLEVN